MTCPGVGAEITVVDYVFHEVLAAEDPELVEVLTDVSVVDRVNPSLAHALTGRRDAVDLLLRAEARGLFVNRLALKVGSSCTLWFVRPW